MSRPVGVKSKEKTALLPWLLLILYLPIMLRDQHLQIMGIVKSNSAYNTWINNNTSSFDASAQEGGEKSGNDGDDEQSSNPRSLLLENKMYNDYSWSRYCKEDQVPCIAILSATHHEGITSTIDPRTLKSRVNHDDKAQEHLRQRILVREAYCAIHLCDVIIDYNDYTENQTMWLQDYGKGKVGKMPPHWNKVASIKRWLSYNTIFDAVVWLDMDTTIVDFDTSLSSMYESTPTMRFPGNPQFIFLRQGDVSRCLVDSWWYYGTSPGCRYFKYPQNHMGQTQDLDMPWLWYSVLKCSELYSHHEQSFECLNQCNGPKEYVDHLGKDPEQGKHFPLWIGTCYKQNLNKASKYISVIDSNMFEGKHLNYELQWGARLSETEAMNTSVSVHRKDSAFMVNWLNRTEALLLSLNCTQTSCKQADGQSLSNKLGKWGPYS